MKPLRVLNLLAALVLALSTFTAAAQTYPNKTVKMLVPFPPAGATDAVARFVALKLAERWGHSVVVENRPGAGGSIGSDLAAKSAPDGYTLLMATTSTHSIGPTLSKLPYDPIKDFTPIIHVADVPNVLLVSPTLPVKTLKELVAYAKARPGQLNYGSSGPGTIVHLNAELFKLFAGVDIQHVPYKGTALAIPYLANGQIAMLFVSLASAMPHIKSNRGRPIAVNASKRSGLLPEIPTLAEAGMPEFNTNTWFGLFAPAGLSKDLTAKIHDDVAAALQTADLRERFASVGAEPVGGSSEQFTARIVSDTVRWAQVIRTAKVKIE